MSLLNNLNKKFNSDIKNTVTLSVRVTNEENAVLQEIADVVGCTRQDVIYQLISDYAIPEWRRMKIESDNEVTDIADENNGVSYFLLNTNKTNSTVDHNIILEQGIAATFEDDYIGKINRIKKGMLFSYTNQDQALWHMVLVVDRLLTSLILKKLIITQCDIRCYLIFLCWISLCLQKM